MSGFNTPDDWGSYYSNCGRCGTRTHASEGHACRCDDEAEHLEAEIDRVVKVLVEQLQARPADWRLVRTRFEEGAALADELNDVIQGRASA